MTRSGLWFLAVTALVTVGCLKVDASVVVNDDGSANATLLAAFDGVAGAEALSGFGDEVMSRDEFCAAFATGSGDVPPDATVEPYDDGQFCGVTTKVDFAASELDEALAALFEGGEDSTATYTLERNDDGGWTFEATGLSDQIMSAQDDFIDPDAPAFAETFADAFAETFIEAFANASFRFALKLPGTPSQHNATSVESDGTVIWDLDPADLPDRLFAKSVPTSTSNSPGPVLIVVAVAAVAIGGTLLALRRKHTKHTTSDLPQ